MKFTLLFILGLCALTASATEFEFFEQDDIYDGTSDKIVEIVENIIKKVTKKFDDILKKIDLIVKWIDNQIDLMVKKAHEIAETVKVETVKKIDEVKRKGGDAAKCAGDLEKEYVRVENDFKADIKDCARGVYAASELMKKNIKVIMAGFQEQVKDFREIAKECADWNPLNVLKCVRDRADKFKKQLSKILGALSGSVKVGELRAVEIMNTAHECDMKALNKAKDRVKKLNESLKQCTKMQFF